MNSVVTVNWTETETAVFSYLQASFWSCCHHRTGGSGSRGDKAEFRWWSV